LSKNKEGEWEMVLTWTYLLNINTVNDLCWKRHERPGGRKNLGRKTPERLELRILGQDLGVCIRQAQGAGWGLKKSTLGETQKSVVETPEPWRTLAYCQKERRLTEGDLLEGEKKADR